MEKIDFTHLKTSSVKNKTIKILEENLGGYI